MPSQTNSSQSESSPSTSQSDSSSQQDSQSSGSESQQGQESAAGDHSESGDNQQASSDAEEANQKAAADGLLTTGQNLIDAASAGSDSDQSTLADQTTSTGSEPWDPLIPETESSNSGEELIFSDSQSASGQPSSEANPQSSDQEALAQESTGADGESESSESKDAASAADTAQGSPAVVQDSQAGGSDPAAQQLAQTLLQAGQSLNRAGQALADMPADGEVSDIEQLLAEARIAVMVSEQALEAASGENSTQAGNSAILGDASIFLGDANRALILATNVLLSGDLGLPDATDSDSTTGNQRISELDKALQDSIVVFQEGVLEARQVATRTQSPPTATAADGPQAIIIKSQGEEETGAENSLSEDPLMAPVQQGRMLDQTAQVAVNTAVVIPDDIPSPQGDDIVAQQLREAAMAEKDPDLQAKLWEEYKRYKEGM